MTWSEFQFGLRCHLERHVVNQLGTGRWTFVQQER